MNTTFTTYAEKKAKQFFNLLQGYTKGIRMTAILILLLMGVSNAWGVERIYLKLNAWKNSGARYAARFYNDNGNEYWQNMYETSISQVFACDIPSDGVTYNKVIFVRLDPKGSDSSNGGNNWNNKWNQSGDITFQKNKLCTQTNSWDSWTGTWSAITWYITGSFNEWKTNNSATSYTLNANTTYEFKVYSSQVGYFSNEGKMDRGNHSNWDMYANVGNCTLTTDIAGTYVFTYNGDKMNVTYPEDCYLPGTFNGWTENAASSLKSGSVTLNLAANTTYTFKIHNFGATSASWHGNTGTMTRDNCTNWEMKEDANCKITTDFAGNYTFTYDRSTQKLSVTYPTIYQVKYSHTPSAAADAPTATVPNGNSVLANTEVTFTAKDAKTGYTWKGWYSDNIGSGTALSANKQYTTTITANTTIYAVYTANTYTVDLDQTGATKEGTKQVTATYGSAMPSATMPTRVGYTFGGYWTEKEGKGTKYYNVNGTSAKKWDQTSDDILYAHWEEAQYTVTFGTTGHGQILFENTSTVISGSGSGTSQQKHGASISFTATPSAGYEVEGWYSDADCTKRIEAAGTHTRYNPAPVTSDVTIYVKFKEETRRIYLKPAGDNGWAGGNPRYVVYIKNDGSGNEDTSWSKEVNMTKINDGDSDTGNDIYYADILKKYSHIIFCRMNPGDLTNKWDNRWTQTKDLQILEDCNLFDVAADASTENQYLADGKWMEYNAWHLVGSFSSWDPCGNRFDENSDGTYTYTIELTEGNYEFKLVRNGIWYGNNGDMERTGTGVQSGGWDMHHDAGDCTLKADMTGNYIFTIHENGKLTVTYPVTGYQLKITMNNGKVYTSNSVGNTGEILSFFAPGKDEPTDNAGVVQLCFEGKPIQAISSETFETSNVYVAKLNANKNGITDIAPYDGNYYIRTDGAAGGWNNYKQNSNKMTYFVPREEEKYSYYWVESVRHSDDNNRVNVKGCVGNQYNNDLAGMIESDKFTDINGDVFIVDPTVNGNLHREKVNLRFGYNPKTNFFERAMLTGSGNTSTFLNITDPEGYVYKINDNGTLDKQLTTPGEDSKFMDISNWVYQTDVWVNIPSDEVDITVQLTGTAYNKAVNSLFGFDDINNTIPTQKTIIGAKSSVGKKKMRIVYDFKTNRMIMAWIPGETSISGNETLQADVLFVRQENKEVPQLTFAQNGQIEGVKSQFFALELINDKDSTYGNHEKQYWLSLPFDCVVGSISGVPGYMEIWGIQRYNGKKRAEIGWFKETSTFWEWLTPKDTLKAGEGYVLSFDKNAATWNTFDLHDDAGNVTGQTSLLRLYFPSMGTGYTFHNAQPERSYINQNCTITRDNRHLQDGNWKIIGPMSYNNVTATPNIKTNPDSIWKPGQDGDHVEVPNNYQWSAPMFRYRYWRNLDPTKRNDWKYIPENGQTSVYQSFYGYMVQFAGTIQWNSVSESFPSALAARRNAASIPNNITTRLVLEDAREVLHDQTFVALDVDGTTTFDQNKDLNKVLNTGYANIYTLSEGIPFAGNTLPMEEVIVPVGVQIATDGEYTFAMPDGTEGMVVELIDYELETTTNLLLFDYTVTLPKGTNEGRFALHIQPSKSGVTTGVENVGDKAKGIEKYLIDGKLIIRTAEGEVFDAQGHRL